MMEDDQAVLNKWHAPMQVTRAAIYVESTYIQEMLHLRIHIKLVNELIMV
jgi:hypothetical protein